MTILKRKPFRVLLAGLLCSAAFAALPMTVSADNANQAGDHITWAYDDDNDTLTFTGTGPMWDFDTGDHQRTYDGYLKQATTVVFDSGITHIGNQAFYDVTDDYDAFTITTVTMANTVTSIGDGAFWRCVLLNTVNLPDSLVKIGNNAFNDCHNLQSITLPDSVTTIGDDAFNYCTILETVKFPAGLTSLGSEAFQDCINLKTADLAVTKLTVINTNTFRNCTLSTLTLPETLTRIEEFAFSNADYYNTDDIIKSFTIPQNVVYIGTDAFYGLDSVTDVYCYADPSNLTWKDKGCDDFAGAANSYTTVCYVPADYLKAYETNFGTSVNVTFMSQIDMDLGEHLYGYSLSLDGDIGVNFYMELPDSLKNSDTAEMVFTVPNGDKTETQTLSVKAVTADENNAKEISGKTYYKFKCKVSAKDMASEITAQIVDGSIEGTEYKYSVKDYADYLLAHTEVEEYGKAAPLVRSMLNYGASAQTYFGTTEAGLANAGYEDNNLSEVNAELINKSTYTTHTLPDGVTFEGATLSLKSQTTLSLYFKSNSELTFTCDNMTVESASNAEYKIARIRNINAKSLNSDFTLKINGNPAVTYSPMNYCYNVLKDGTTDIKLQNVCRALFKYWSAAKDYFV
ncbi:Leucine rich repeat-containing protein [Ruminococcaceae bacterium FB2012]|nr:Leucine rich repeat-containing protein [Ruminococcaceae bacterium FB2012]